jgi:uncharacterized membrane protein YhdT
MTDLALRFLIGGAIVSVFAVIGDLLRPKSFAGLFGAAPSVALATLALTVRSNGAAYAALEARSMIAGSVALFSYAYLVSWVMMRYARGALSVTAMAMPLWFSVAALLWLVWLR